MARASTARADTDTDDPYAALGLTKSATEAQIKQAYRKLVRTSHPDINPDDPQAEARFKRITSAHDLLKDPATRARFDAGEIDASGQDKPQRRYYRDHAGAAGQPGAQQSGFGGQGFGGQGGFGGMGAEDIFADILRQRGAGRSQGFAAPGPDQGYALTVPFLDAVRGATTRITLPGEGDLAITIPPGLRDGQTLRLRGKGGAGFGGGPRGDAQVTVSVAPHPVFQRDGNTIKVTLPITLDEAVLGAKVQVPTVTGDVTLTIPKGSSSGKILRLRGRGVPTPDGVGDQLVELRIVVPKADDPELAAFLTAWRSAHHDDPRAAMMKGVPR